MKDTLHRAYTFAHGGVGPHGGDWSVSGVDTALSANWTSLLGGSGAAMAAAGQDVALLRCAVLSALGIVSEVIPVAETAAGRQNRIPSGTRVGP